MRSGKVILAILAGAALAGPLLAQTAFDRGDRRDDRREWRDDRREWRDDRRNWRDDRIDRRWQGPRWRGPAYVYPHGYGYRRWGPGYRLPRPYFGGGYWVDDPRFYRLQPPWGGTRWIRVGPDALLIRLVDGRVLRAVRGVWW